MKGIQYDLGMGRAALRKLRLAGPSALLRYRSDWPDPRVEYPNQVRVRNLLAGICATDVHMADLTISMFPSILNSPRNPSPMGHEVMGIVEQVGAEVAALREGDRVVFFPMPACRDYGFEPCPACRRGDSIACGCLCGTGDGTSREEAFGGRGRFGGWSGGGFSERLVGFEGQFFRVPEGVPDEAAVLTEPLAVALHGVVRHPPAEGSNVLVIGAGIIGLLTVAALRAAAPPCRVLCLARHPFQEEAALRLGADRVLREPDRESLYRQVAEQTGARLFRPLLSPPAVYGGAGPDVIYDCVATERSIGDALRLARSNGRIVTVGLGYARTRTVDWSLQVYKELEMAGSMAYGMEPGKEGGSVPTFELALRLLERDPGHFAGLLTHTFPIDAHRQAFACTRRKGLNGAVKVAFDYR